MKVSLKQSDVFIPDWNDNLDLPADEQVKVYYRFLGTGDRAKYIYRKNAEWQFSEKGDSVGTAEMVTDGRGLAMRMVTKIEGLELDLDNKVVRIETIADFYKYSLPDLAALIEAEMLNATAVVDSKNSE